jgi:hypothetical protein
MNRSRPRPAAIALLTTLAAPAAWSATCGELNAALASPHVIAVSAAIVPAAGNTPGYCRVELRVPEAINIRVGLPLSAEDGGGGAVQGAWNGKVQNLGGGGYSGNVGNVAGAVAAGYVGSSTDTGHSPVWCNETDPQTGLPNSQPNCGLIGGGFVLDAQNQLQRERVRDFITDSLREQTEWSLKLAAAYYGMPAQRNYWNGCSTGGRQGFEMAQKYADLFDGFLVGAPAMNWNRFIMGNLWAPVVTNSVLGAAGLSPAKSDAANAAATAACDAQDGVVDGLVTEPRRCQFDAQALQCTGAPGEAATCLTAAEASVVNSIWNGPLSRTGEKLWGGVTRGASFNTNLPAGNNANGINATYLLNWMHEDPLFDWRNVTAANYEDEFFASYVKYRELASTDEANLDGVVRRGAKIIHYHGLADALIYPFTSFNYVSRVLDRYGVQQTHGFMRSYFYPGVGHCAGGNAPQPVGLFDTLVNWVENGVAPDHVVSVQSATATQPARSRKVCKYPDELVYNGPNPNDQSSYSCRAVGREPQDLRDASRTLLERGNGVAPLPR